MKAQVVHSLLIIDDNRDLTRALEIRLLANGYRIWCAENRDSAIKLALCHKPGAVLLDLNFPGDGGLDMLKKFRGTREFAALPVIVMTGDDSPLTKKRVLEAGALALLQKPLDHQVLLATLQEAEIGSPTSVSRHFGWGNDR